jgi:hypothetical protein
MGAIKSDNVFTKWQCTSVCQIGELIRRTVEFFGASCSRPKQMLRQIHRGPAACHCAYCNLPQLWGEQKTIASERNINPEYRYPIRHAGQMTKCQLDELKEWLTKMSVIRISRETFGAGKLLRLFIWRRWGISLGDSIGFYSN